MLPYVIVAILSISFAAIIDKTKEKNKIARRVLYAVIVIMLSLFAAMRNYHVGTDIETYGFTFFENDSAISDLIKTPARYRTIEYGYHALNVLVRQFTANFRIFLFIHQAALASFVVHIAEKRRKNNKESVVVFVISYLFIWYCVSFNIIRQSLSIFILLLSYPLLEKGQYKKYTILILISSLFHQSMLLYLPITLVSKMIKEKNGYKKAVILSIIILILFELAEPIFDITTSVLPSFLKYSSYFSRGFTNCNKGFLLYKVIVFLYVLYWSLKTKVLCDIKNKPLFGFLLYDLVFYWFAQYIAFGYRFSYVFLAHYVLYLPRIDAAIKGDRAKAIFRFGLLTILCGYWAYRHIGVGYDGVYPYKFLGDF